MLLTMPTSLESTPMPRKQRRRGTTLMEYLMMISLIITVCLVGIGYFGSSTSGGLGHSATQINKSLKKGS